MGLNPTDDYEDEEESSILSSPFDFMYQQPFQFNLNFRNEKHLLNFFSPYDSQNLIVYIVRGGGEGI